MPQPALFSEYAAYATRSRDLQAALKAGRIERSRAASALFTRLAEALHRPFRRRDVVAVPPRGVRMVVCNDC